MTNLLQLPGAVLCFGLLLALVAFLRFRFGLNGGVPGRLTWRNFWLSEFGVFAVTYNTPGYVNANTTTAPTAAQASAMPELACIVSFADADATGTIVTNWGSWYLNNVPNALNSFASFLLPKITVVQIGNTASPSSFSTGFSFGLTNSNQVTMNKLSLGVGSGGSFAVYLQRALSRG